MNHFRNVVRRYPWAGASGIALLVALFVTMGGRWRAVHGLEEDVTVRQEAVVEEALETVQKRFTALYERTHSRAHRLATDSVVVAGLQTWSDRGERSSRLLRYVTAFPLGSRTSVEVYSPSLDLLAWAGTQVPRGDETGSTGIPEAEYGTIVSDGTVRQALSVWIPVQGEEGAIGAVRVVRVLRYQPPVQNRYIQAYDVVEAWEEAAGESIRVTWGSASSSSSDWFSTRLQADAGPVLGRVLVDPPSRERMVRRTAQFYNDLLALWGTLLLLWGVSLSGTWYYRLARRPGVCRHRRALSGVTGRFFGAASLWVGARYALLALDVPGRWVSEGTPLAPLFDPTRFASTIGGGLFRSIGDLFLTSGWAVVLAVGMVHLGIRYGVTVSSLRDGIARVRRHGASKASPAGVFSAVGGVLGVVLVMVVGLAYVVRRVVLDSTLDFFSRTGLLPDPLVFVVFCSLFLLLVAVVLTGTGATWIGGRLAVRYWPRHWSWELGTSTAVAVVVAAAMILYFGRSVAALVSVSYLLGMGGVIAGAAVYGLVGRAGGTDVFTVRGQLLSVFLGALLLYPLLYAGMDAQRRERMVEAARSFEEGYDPRVLYSLRQGLRTAEETFDSPLDRTGAIETGRFDSLATRLVDRSLLSSLPTYELSLTLVDSDGTLLRRYTAAGSQRPRAAQQADRDAFDSLRRLYELQPTPGPIIDRLPVQHRGQRRTGRFQYAGLLGLSDTTGAPEYWVLLRADPRSFLPGTSPDVPRALLPDGSVSDLYAQLSLAEFREGTLVRRFGPGFGRTQLPGRLAATVGGQHTLWRSETVRDRSYLTYYRSEPEQTDGASTTIAVRIPSVLAFDHLYYMLRLTVAGLGIGFLFYVFGVYGRYQKGLLPARRIRFRDKVLNAFLIVGIVSTGAVGVVGVQLVTGENERLIERRLRDELSRVEEALALEAQPGEQLWQVARRSNVDSLSARVGLDLRFYEDGALTATSRPRLVQSGLVNTRLPGSVYHTLYGQAYSFAVARAAVGSFSYRVGYQAFADEQGRPRVVVGVPTLAQQEQLEQEQTRTLAYLFGALLVLVVVVMFTAVVLANALAKPIARLREGLTAVGEGRFAQSLTVDTRDEIGDLVRTFNEMREQLAESRRKLAQQERELAWREMARQVAHEIKNPLTPMKLSIQHLRRSFKREQLDAGASDFAEVFDRITTTLIEQIESLVRIADEFSTFARLPTRVPEPLDLNEVIQEAARLMEKENETDQIDLDLHPGPLVVEADREELRRIYINLIKNALQAIPDDREGRVRITTTTTGDGHGRAHSRIVDNGAGIPPDLRDKIFEPNFSTKTGGTGLGLAIAQKTVDELGGEIGFETTDGEGTTFWIQLPLAEDQA